MAEPRQRKTKLSKNLLQMKFMQRSAAREEQEELAAEQQKLIDDEHWVLDIPELAQKESMYQIEPSYGPCQDLGFGRMSFKGFNPEIEKIMFNMNMEKELTLARREAAETQKQNAADDLELAQSYGSLSGTIAKTFANKKRRHEMEDEPSQTQRNSDLPTDSRKPKKKKFLKPKD